MVYPIKRPQQWHFEAYEYWFKGKTGQSPTKTYKEVADHFKVSVAQIQRVANFYEWNKKLIEARKKEDDIFVGQINLVVGEIRKRQIKHIHAVSGWVKELTAIHEILIREKREPTEEEKAQMKRLNAAIDDFDSKDARDRTSDLKENVHFAPAATKALPEEVQKQLEGVTVVGPTLIIMSPGQKEKKPITIQAQPLEIENGEHKQPV